MLVSEILRIKGNTLFTTTPDGKVLDAVAVLAHHDIGSLVVMDRGRMAGLLTFAEVLKAMAERAGKASGLGHAEGFRRHLGQGFPTHNLLAELLGELAHSVDRPNLS